MAMEQMTFDSIVIPSGRIVTGEFSPFRPRSIKFKSIRKSFGFLVLCMTSCLTVIFMGLGFRLSQASLPTVAEEVSLSALSRLEHQDILTSGRLANVKFVSDIIRDQHKRTNASELARAIVIHSEKAHLDPLFVAAIIKSESAFLQHAKSPVGALGLMQVLPSTGKYISDVRGVKWYGPWKLTDPNYNIRLGIEYVKYLSQMFNGNMEHALVAYNWGPGNLIDALKYRRPIPASTVKYARTILSNHKLWKRDLDAQRAGLINPSTVG